MLVRMKIIDRTLEGYLKSDIKLLDLPTDFDIEFRGFSSKYYGRYYVKDKKIVVYILDNNGERLPYHEILDTVLHEAIHHYQHYYEVGFIRVREVMHNLNFHKMYEEKKYKLIELEVIPCA